MTHSLRLLLHFLSLLAFARQTTAHFNLIKPPPYQTRACNARLGCGPCPAWNSSGATSVTTIWQRGSIVNVTWQRNNHKDGFYRRSFVPIDREASEPFKNMNDPEAHEKTAFNWGCWTQGNFKCRLHQLEPCRVDKSGIAYTNLMVVPEVMPDGDYVFSMTWFGGSNRTEVKKPEDAEAKFSNFAACAYVTIRGGAQLADAYFPTFTRGVQEKYDKMPDQENLKPNQCWSTSTKVQECGGLKCPGRKVRALTPAKFMSGNPSPLLRSTISNLREEREGERRQKRNHPSSSSTPSTTPWSPTQQFSSSPMITPTQSASTIAISTPSTSSSSTIMPVMSTTPLPSRDPITTSAPRSQASSESTLASVEEQRWKVSYKWKETCGVWKQCIDYCSLPKHQVECFKEANKGWNKGWYITY